MAEPTDPPSGKPLVLRVESSAEGGGTLSVPALEAGLRAFADRPKLVEPPHTPDPSVVAELTQRESELERRQARLDEAEQRLNERELEFDRGSGHTASEKIRLAGSSSSFHRSRRIGQWWTVTNRPSRLRKGRAGPPGAGRR